MGLVNGEMMPFTDWDGGEPNDGGDGELRNYAYSGRRGRWGDRPCGRNYHYVWALTEPNMAAYLRTGDEGRMKRAVTLGLLGLLFLTALQRLEVGLTP